jgi:hypothetical protein
MAQWNLAQIRLKTRQVTGRLTTDDMTNEELDTRINQYYQLRFPAEVKLEQKLTYYKFLTTANQAYYDVPQETYTNFEPPATVNNLNMLWYQNPAKFEQDNLTTALQYSFLTPWTGDGATVTFTTTVTGFPIFPGSTTINDDVETFLDTNQDWTTSNVTITGSAGGTATINYSTGVVSVTFNTAPINGQVINLNYIIFQAGRPQAILYFNNQFELLPPPDQAYIVQMQAYQVVAALTAATDTPELNEWGPCLSYGTALGIFADYGENDAYAETTRLHKEQISLVYSRTEQDLLNIRALPNF